jgi:HEAT repeat protein/MFS family permease
MISAKIASALNVRAGEWREVTFFWFFCFFSWFALGLGDATSDTLFIKRVGFENLPYMFIACALVAIPISLVLTLFQGKIEKRKLTLYSGIVSALLILLAVNLVSSQDLLAFPTFGFYFLYLISNTLQFVMPVILSVLIGTQFNSLKGKRLVPIIFTGSIAGRIAAGAGLTWLAGSYSLTGILWLWLILHSIAFLLFGLGSNTFVKAQIQNYIESRNERKKNSFLVKLKKFLATVLESRLVLFLVLSSLFSTVLFFMAEFQCAEVFNRSFPSENELARFYGFFTIFASLLAFLFQGGITGSLIQRLGISNSNTIFPSLVLTGFAGTFVSFTFLPAVWLKFVLGGLSNALFEPVNHLFYNALPVKEKARIITINEGVILPLGTVFTGVFLIKAVGHDDLVKILPIVFAVLWITLTTLMKKPYKEGLLQLLRSSKLEFHQGGELEKLPLDRNTMSLLLVSLENSDQETASMIIQLVFNNGDRERREAVIKKLANFSIDRRISILRRTVLPVDRISGEFLFNSLKVDEVELQELALRSLARFPASERLRSEVEPFLNSPTQDTRRLAAVILARIGDLDQMLQSLKILQSTIHSDDEDEKLKGIEIIGFTGDERFWVNLKPFLSSADTRIRLAATASLEKIVGKGEADELYEVIGSLVKDSSREIRFLSLKILRRLTAPKWFYHLIEGLSDSSPRNRHLAQEILISHYDDKFSELITVLESNETSLHAKTTVAGILAVSQDQAIREYLHQFGQKIIRQLYELKVEEYILARDLGPEKTRYIRMLLSEKAWAYTKLIVCLVAPEQNREARDLFKSLYSSNEELISNAIEVLQNMGERQLVYHIIPVLENISLENIAGYGMKVFAIRDRVAPIILGKFLTYSDAELKEAAAYTVSCAEIYELLPVLKKIRLDTGQTGESLRETCSWALDRLEGKGLLDC